MAKRRKLMAPSADALNKLEEEFRRETVETPFSRGGQAPIAQVAAEAAGQTPVVDAEERAKQASNEADAGVLKDAKERGLLVAEIPLTEIDLEDMIRDRVTLDEAAMLELRLSISANGLRLPVELYELAEPVEGRKYGIVSGYRRILATKGLLGMTGDERYATIKAFIKPLNSVSDAFVAMVEENEVRSQLTQFERGRIAVISTQNGVFSSVSDAVNALFASASKAKRSKVRSFAQIFEELGDMLSFPEGLKERQGLRLAGALRMGAESQLRNVLASRAARDADDEWDLILPVIEAHEEAPRDPKRGGRPKSPPADHYKRPNTRQTKSGFTLSRDHDGESYLIRFGGRKVDAEFVDLAIAELERLLEK